MRPEGRSTSDPNNIDLFASSTVEYNGKPVAQKCFWVREYCEATLDCLKERSKRETCHSLATHIGPHTQCFWSNTAQLN